MPEKTVQYEVFKALGGRTDVRLFRNSVGAGWVGKECKGFLGPVYAAIARKLGRLITLINPRFVPFGLMKYSADLVGWQSVAITPDMVGTRVAVFLSVETKAPKGRTESERKKGQENWRDQVNRAGGIAGIVRSVEDANQILFNN